jgi:hypothetical protein
MKALFAIPLVLTAGLLTAGCGGGGGGGGTTTTQALTKKEYTAKLDTICAATNEAGKGLDLSSVSKIAANGDKATDLLNKMVDKINAIEPPKEVQDAAKSFVAGLQKEANDFGELTKAAKAGDAAKVQTIEGDLSSEAAASSEDARFVGATGCARLFS